MHGHIEGHGSNTLHGPRKFFCITVKPGRSTFSLHEGPPWTIWNRNQSVFIDKLRLERFRLWIWGEPRHCRIPELEFFYLIVSLRSLSIRLAAFEANLQPNSESQEQRKGQKIVAASKNEGQGSEEGPKRTTQVLWNVFISHCPNKKWKRWAHKLKPDGREDYLRILTLLFYFRNWCFEYFGKWSVSNFHHPPTGTCTWLWY